MAAAHHRKGAFLERPDRPQRRDEDADDGEQGCLVIPRQQPAEEPAEGSDVLIAIGELRLAGIGVTAITDQLEEPLETFYLGHLLIVVGAPVVNLWMEGALLVLVSILRTPLLKKPLFLLFKAGLLVIDAAAVGGHTAAIKYVLRCAQRHSV